MEKFLAVHGAQLKAISLPNSLINNLYNLLTTQPSAGNHGLKVEDGQTVCTEELQCSSKVFVLEHAWQSDGSQAAHRELRKNHELCTKIAELLDVPPRIADADAYDDGEECDALEKICECSRKDAKIKLDEMSGDLIGTAACLIDQDAEDEANKQAMKRASEASENEPERDCSFEEFRASMVAGGYASDSDVENDAYLLKMYENFLRSGKGFGMTIAYNWSDGGDGTISVYVPLDRAIRKANIKSTLSNSSWKLVVGDKVILDGKLQATVKADGSFWSIEEPGLFCMTLEKVENEFIWKGLLKGEVQLSSDEVMSRGWYLKKTEEMHLEDIFDRMWFFNQTFSSRSPDGKAAQPVWYLTEAIGLHLQHSFAPNFKCSPFFFADHDKAYTLMWPLKHVHVGEKCTRNFVPHIFINEPMSSLQSRLLAYDHDLGMNGLEEHNENTKEENNESTKIEKLLAQITVHGSSEDNTQPVTRTHRNIHISSAYQPHTNDIAGTTPVDDPLKADISLVALADVNLSIAGEAFSACELSDNKSFAKTFFKFAMEETSRTLMPEVYILPQDLPRLHTDAVMSGCASQYWLCKATDASNLKVEPFVTSDYKRISRMCEVGSLYVTKYISLQPNYLGRKFSLVYAVVYLPTSKKIFVHKRPLVRRCFDADVNLIGSFINEYDNAATVPSKSEKIVSNQNSVFYQDFESAMNKFLTKTMENLLLWKQHQQDHVYKAVGAVATEMCEAIIMNNIASDAASARGVLFGVNIVLDEALRAHAVDVEMTCPLASVDVLEHIVRVVDGSDACGNFVQVDRIVAN